MKRLVLGLFVCGVFTSNVFGAKIISQKNTSHGMDYHVKCSDNTNVNISYDSSTKKYTICTNGCVHVVTLDEAINHGCLQLLKLKKGAHIFTSRKDIKTALSADYMWDMASMGTSTLRKSTEMEIVQYYDNDTYTKKLNNGSTKEIKLFDSYYEIKDGPGNSYFIRKSETSK